ncbi:NAD(P)-dependent alcohol dehydrogenase [Streptomyces misionensis]|uniref:NAD(P)-dependent alcohol dehydrogenase n=1 Tax=Streptomyces misionensis TaxID=67331 RepID=UPI0033EB4CE6
MTIEQFDLDDPAPDEISVRIAATGICRTDLHIRDGDYPIPSFPVIPGHEGAGIVTAVGSAVTDVAIGDHVLLTYPFCGQCENCRRGMMAYCEQGFVLSFGGTRLDGSTGWRRSSDGTSVNGHVFQQSSFASHTLAAARSAVILDRDLPLDLAAAFGCGVSTGAGSVLNAMELHPDSQLVILGAGTVGLSALMMAHHLGVEQIIAVDTNADRLAIASALGARHTVNASELETRDAIQQLTEGGAGYIFDTTGHPNVVADALDALAMTGTVVMAGAAPAGARTSLDMNVLLNGRGVRGTIQGDADTHQLVPHLIDLYRQGRFPVDSLVSTYPFAEIQRAIADMDGGRVIKPILRMPTNEVP